MQKIVYRHRIDAKKHGTQFVINVYRNDGNTRVLILSVLDGSTPLKISDDNVNATVYCVKPDETVVYEGSSVIDDNVIVELSQQTCAVAGTVKCQLRIVSTDENKNTQLLTCPEFEICVHESNYDDNAIESTNEFSSLILAENDVRTATEKANTAAQNANAIATEIRNARANGEFNGPQGEKGEDGADYVLTEADKTDIANHIDLSVWEKLECNEYRTDSDEYILPYVNIGVMNKHTVAIPKVIGGKISGQTAPSGLLRLMKADVSALAGKKVKIHGRSQSVPTYPCAFCTAEDDLTILETYGNDRYTLYGIEVENPELLSESTQVKDAVEAVIPQGAKYLYVMGGMATSSGVTIFDAVPYLEVLVLDKSIADAVKELQSPLANKKLAVDGDSICYGNGYTGGYGKLIAEKYGMTLQNNAVGGASIAIGTTNAVNYGTSLDWENTQYYLKIVTFDWENNKSAETTAFPISREEYLNGFGVYPTTYKLVDGEMQEQEYSETMPPGTSFIRFDIPMYDGNTVPKYYRIWNHAEHNAFWERYRSGFGTEGYVKGDTQLYTARHWLCKDIAKIDADSDYIVIEGGINDYLLGRRLGTITEDMTSVVDITTTAGAAEYLCRQLIERFSDRKIAFVITHKAKTHWRTKNNAPGGAYTLQECYNTISQVMKKYSIPVVDLSENARFNTEIQTLLKYTHNSDGVHPNKEGYELFYVPLISGVIERI